PAAVDTVDLAREIQGQVHTDVLRVGVNYDGTSGDDAFTTDFTSTQYYVYTPTGTGTDTVTFYDAATAGNILLTRTKDLTSDKTVNVGKVSGDTHADLYSGTLEVWDTLDTATNKLSSETVNPASASTPDYKQYFEADATNPVTTMYYLKASTSDSLVSRGNGFTLQTDYSFTKDLVVEKTGKVTSDITKVGIDLDEDLTINNNDVYTTDFDTDDEYEVFTVTDSAVDVRYYTGAFTEVLKIDEDFTSAGTYENDVSRLVGEVPVSLASGTVEIEKAGYTDGVCGGSFYAQAYISATPGSASPDYTIYYEADGTTYSLLYCAATGPTNVLAWNFVSDTTGGETETIDVSEISGTVEYTYNGGANSMQVYDDRSSYPGGLLNGLTAGTSISFWTETGAGTPDTYTVYFIESDDTRAPAIDVDEVDLRMADSSNYVSWR
ncbi:hypothetical protein COY95_00295, partial [Candidatus Woesearchaeota archaeon CG_4_10_14_0_8_um_filter_47_5]